jgi:hypothetical protein
VEGKDMQVIHVQTKEDYQEFHGTHAVSYRKNEWEIKKESYLAERFWIRDGKENIATVEFIPYRPDVFSVVEDIPGFTFRNEPEIQSVLEHEVMEIDRLTVLKKYRRTAEPLNVILSLIHDFAFEKGIRYYVTLLEPRFFKLLERFYKIPIRRTSSEDIYYPLDQQFYTPAIIDVMASEQLEKPWYVKPGSQ